MGVTDEARAICLTTKQTTIPKHSSTTSSSFSTSAVNKLTDPRVMSSQLVFICIIVAVMLQSTVLFVTAQQQSYGDALQRNNRAPAQLNTFLVPFPRVGKRSISLSPESSFTMKKRLYLARVGKRSYMFAARVGK